MLINSNNPEINVDKLMAKVKQEVAKRQSSFPIQPNIINEFQSNEDLSDYFYRIESLLNNSEFNSQLPSDLPEKINKFPLNLTIFKKIILKVYNFLFKKQKIVNSDLIQAVRESLLLNQQLITKLNATETRLNTIEQKLNNTETKFNQ